MKSYQAHFITSLLSVIAANQLRDDIYQYALFLWAWLFFAAGVWQWWSNISLDDKDTTIQDYINRKPK